MLVNKSTLKLKTCFVLVLTFTAVAQGQDNRELVFNNGVVSVSEDVNVPTLATGLLTKLKIKLGQRIQAGELIGLLASEDLQAERSVLEAEKELASIASRNDINIRFSRRSSEVSKSMHQKACEANAIYPETVSKSELDRLRLEAERADLSIEKAELDMETAAAQVTLSDKKMEALAVELSNRSIRSPCSGIVVQAPFSAGEWLERGQTFARIIRTDQVEVIALGDANDVDEHLVGRVVTVESPNLKNKMKGKVWYVMPEINPASGQVQIRAMIENSDGALRPGSRVTMKVIAQ